MIVLALVGFFYTPRSGYTWQLGGESRRQLVTGNSEDPNVDLNVTGKVELSRDVAFDVFAEDNGKRPKLDLSPNQRWRGPVYALYGDGKWQKAALRASTPGREMLNPRTRLTSPVNLPPSPRLPDYGPDQFFLQVNIRARIGPTPFVATPILRGRLPVIQVFEDGRTAPFYHNEDTSLTTGKPLAPGQRFRQVMLPGLPADISRTYELDEFNRDALYAKPQAPGVEQWTRELLARLVATGRLPEQALTERTLDGDIHPRNHERIARALELHLSSAGEYVYSLHIERMDKTLDPVLDFLMNVRQGDCFRFASALAVMLKSIGIPCQLVLGYRGADSRGDGYYDVRQCHAHAWVEVLVSREEGQPAHGMHGGYTAWRFLTLDPTPYQESMEASLEANRRWWNSSDWNRDKLFKDLFINYSPEMRAEASERFWEAIVITWQMSTEKLLAETPEGDRFRANLALLGLNAVVGVLLVRAIRPRFRGRSARRQRADTQFQRRLLAILARRGWIPAVGQTLREFTLSLTGRLRSRADATDLLERIDRIASLFYRVRFGERPLGREETQAVQRDLDHLSRALARD
jgi:transglutaminase-like putative cysteine protease